MANKVFHYLFPFELESGNQLDSVEISYHTYGSLNPQKDNVVWVFHALTANSDAADWWSGLVGDNKIFTPKKYFIVCANILGSCLGTSGPLSINRKSGKKYYGKFPQITIRDITRAHILLKQHLGIEKILIGIGGSMGGYQLLEWSILEKNLFSGIILMNTCARETAWAIAIHTAQRLALEADATLFKANGKNNGAKGLKAARAIGMLTYRNYEILKKTQTEENDSVLDNFKASSYINYQGEKLVNRFNAISYWILTKAMDSHNIFRGRINLNFSNRLAEEKKVLKRIKAKTLVIGISSDILCPVAEQKFLARNIPGAKISILDSPFGHDGFLTEGKKISAVIKKWLKIKFWL